MKTKLVILWKNLIIILRTVILAICLPVLENPFGEGGLFTIEYSSETLGLVMLSTVAAFSGSALLIYRKKNIIFSQFHHLLDYCQYVANYVQFLWPLQILLDHVGRVFYLSRFDYGNLLILSKKNKLTYSA